MLPPVLSGIHEEHHESRACRTNLSSTDMPPD
jgi:hypothetical protein